MDNIISCIEQIVERSKDSRLSEEFWKECESAIDYMTEKIGLSKIQCVFISIFANSELSMDLTRIAEHLGLSRIGMIKYKSEIDNLVELRWLSYVEEMFQNEVLSYELRHEVLDSLAKNDSYVPESLKVDNIQQFVEKIASHFGEHIKGDYEQFRNHEAWINAFMTDNSDMEICKAIKKYRPEVRIMLFCLISDFSRYHYKREDSIQLEDLKGICRDKREQYKFECAMQRGTMVVMKDGYVEHKCGDGLAIPDGFVLTQKAREEWFSDYVPNPVVLSNHIKQIQKDLTKWTTIKKKDLFYNPEEQQLVDTLFRILSHDELLNIQKRLEEKSMRKGITILLSGAPGTGKTELVKQIARINKRHLYSVDLSEIRSKWVGESEANVRRIFRSYEMMTDSFKEKCPILFINECDGLLGVRTSRATSSVDKMNNTMQNILLEALENTNGIVICTTNMTGNLDKAFMRRFLFKAEFNKPNKEVRRKIFSSILPELKKEEVEYLASKYIITGGEIENVSRKIIIDYVLNGYTASVSQIDAYCKEEQMGKDRRSIGFDTK